MKLAQGQVQIRGKLLELIFMLNSSRIRGLHVSSILSLILGVDECVELFVGLL